MLNILSASIVIIPYVSLCLQVQVASEDFLKVEDWEVDFSQDWSVLI